MSFVLMTAIIYSCKKDTEPATTSETTTYPNYSQLKSGNYWVYQQFDIDENGTATPKNIFDSCYVEKDTTINGKTYFKIVKPKPYSSGEFDISFQRDSLHYIVNSNGKIMFSSQDFSSIFDLYYIIASQSDTICKTTRQMADKNLTVTTPAGIFSTSNSKETFFMYPNWISGGNQRYMHTKYAENIGIITETLPIFAHDPRSVERRLVRYHIN
jgi:hypothetical protein